MTILDKVLCRPCIFCEVVKGDTPEKLIYKASHCPSVLSNRNTSLLPLFFHNQNESDEEIAAFEDINPAAETHILVVPIAHIENVKSLTSEHSGLLEKMRQKGVDLLKERGHDPDVSNARIGRLAGRSRSLHTKTLVTLVVVIIISAWLLLGNINIMDFDFQYGNRTDSSSYSDNTTTTTIHQHTETHDSNTSSTSIGPLEPAVSLLDPNTKYLSYFPFAGITNQFMGLETALFAAKKLNRTLIIPPLISNTHDHDNTHQRWSRYFDFHKFTHLTGVSVLEWDTVRPLTPAQRQAGRDQALLGISRGSSRETDEWRRVAENITTQIICGYGAPGASINYSAWNFVWHFLFRPVLKQPPPPIPGKPDLSGGKLIEGAYKPEVLMAMDDIIWRFENSEEQLLMLSHTFKIKDPNQGGRIWNEIGMNLHFIPQLMEYATMRVNEELQRDQGIEVLPNDNPEEKQQDSSVNDNDLEPVIPINQNSDATESGEIDNPATSNITAPNTRIPYIAVHLRRGDITSKCPEDPSRCIVPFEFYVDAVARARTIATARGLHSHLPVIVTTDTTSEDDFRNIEKLGWHRIEHSKDETTQLWGPFGEAIVDSAILAQADEFVGSAISTMSRIAAQRQLAWYHRKALYPQVNKPTKRKRSVL
ncbi:hypothetical protein BGX27_010107 [Mortierella sp. AM989]|nr:hypothetical protein BGX27_010107 [Mortierella sp. AM989]